MATMNGRGDQLSQRFLACVVKIIRLTDSLPKTVSGKHIAGQLVRSGTSSGSNYEEGCGADPDPILSIR